MTNDQKTKILYVEDDEAVREMTRDILISSGYDVVAAGSAVSALTALRDPGGFDLLLTDLGLPDMDGREMAEQALAEQDNLQVILVTGYAGADAQSPDFLKTRMTLLSKPFTLRDLLASVRRALD